MPEFKVFSSWRSFGRKWFYSLTAANGEPLIKRSEPYASRHNAHRAIEDLREAVAVAIVGEDDPPK